jgi:hypothetical protein
LITLLLRFCDKNSEAITSQPAVALVARLQLLLEQTISLAKSTPNQHQQINHHPTQDKLPHHPLKW